MGSPGKIHDSMPVATQLPWHVCMDDLTTERSFDLQATWVINVLGLFFEVIHGCLYNQALPDVGLSGA